MREADPAFQITLASGLTWGIRALGGRAVSVLHMLGKTARLGPQAGVPDRILLLRDGLPDEPSSHSDGSAIYDLVKGRDTGTANDMARACSVLAAHTPEALLLHGALAAGNGRAVLLCGPGGRGKTTTSKRLRAPWQALSDDAALVLPNPAGGHAVHPWPTWSRLMADQSEEFWDVGQWLPLDHVFFLSWSEHDTVEAVNRATALCLVLESIEEYRCFLPAKLVCAAQRLKDLETATRLVKSVPVSILHISPDGPFWLAIERVLDARPARP